MKFRTEIDIRRSRDMQLTHHDGIVMLGSCFTDNVGALLARDGFLVTANPMGPLYNPLSIANALRKSIEGHHYSSQDFEIDDNGAWHCLDFCSQYSDNNLERLAQKASDDLAALRQRLCSAQTAILTLGTAYVYAWAKGEKPYVVGNCHKFPANCYNRQLMSTEQVKCALLDICALLPDNITQIILTVSPIRHLGDGLHGNQLSKSTLLLGIEAFMQHAARQHVAYFPSYEIMIDDLRDYRFYAADMKHPSDVAIDYIYQAFCDTFMSPQTLQTATNARQEFLRHQHRQIINKD